MAHAQFFKDRLAFVESELEYVADALEARADEYGKMSLQDALTEFFELQDRYNRLDSLRKRIYKVQDRLNKSVLPQMMFDQDTEKVSIFSLGRSFYPKTHYTASIRDSERAYPWLRENGLSELITTTVNSGTLASAFKDMVLEQGQEPPDDIFKFQMYNSIGISKFTPK